MALKRIVTNEVPEPSANPGSRVASIYGRESSDSRVMVADGYGIRVVVRYGQLEISDGIGRTRRVRQISKADRDIRRLIIKSTNGYVSLDALKWCLEHGISVTALDSAGDLVASHVPESASDVTLLRIQALAASGNPLEQKGIEVTRAILTNKLRGQSANLIKLFDLPRESRRMDTYLSQIPDADDYRELSELERWGANTYFAAWRKRVAVPWTEKELERIPANWCAYDRRNSRTQESGNRRATDPVNAMLNYAYTIGYAESRIACIGASLHPSLGFFHDDTDKRDSLALDLLEVARPDIDAYILGLLGYGSEPRAFTHRDFTEAKGYTHGVVRICPPLTHEIAEQSIIWQERLRDAALEVAEMLGAPIGGIGKRTRNLKRQRIEFISKPVDLDKILPIPVWETEFCSILPPEKTQPKGGFSAISSRNILAAMIYLEHHNRPWAHLPPAFGTSSSSMRHRRQDWSRLGIWDDVHSKILDLATKPIKD
jgi:CRISP-associated protein Cas1